MNILNYPKVILNKNLFFDKKIMLNTLNHFQNKMKVKTLSKYLVYQNRFYFCNQKVSKNDIIMKLNKEGHIQIYLSKYPYNVEKFLFTSSIIFFIISGTTIITSSSYIWKLINIFIVFVPSLFILIEYYANQIRYIRGVKLLPDNKIELKTIFGKNEILSIGDLNRIDDDKRYRKNDFNYRDFIIFTNKKDTPLYHLHRNAIFLNEDIFYDILDGKLFL